MKLNENFLNLKDSYLFSTVARKVREYQAQNKDKKVLKLSIGDVTLPLAKKVIEALHSAVDEMACKETFKGYGPELGYDFLREEIQNYYKRRNVYLERDEIIVSDGAKSDLGNILDIFDANSKVLIPDPVYPAYVDVNIMAGRKIDTGCGCIENGFKPMPDENYKADIIYICSPNNPTGAVYTKEELKEWVLYANKCNALIIFDAAYEAFIQDKNLPRSIFEIEGAKTCAIEICSFSKTAGFTGTRCGYTIVPKQLIFNNVSANALWNRRQSTKFNGTPYIIQKAAAAVFSEEGQKQIQENLQYYRENAKIIKEALDSVNATYVGGENSPYVWFKCPHNMKSWEFFDKLLNEQSVVGTPGAGFGANGEGFFRLTAFSDRETTIEACKRIVKLF